MSADPRAPGPTPAALGAGQVHHVGIVVDDLDAACAHVETVFGRTMRPTPPRPFRCRLAGVERSPTVRTALSLDGPPYVELLQAVDGTLWRPLAGIHHLCYLVDDLVAESDRLVGLGLPIEMEGLGRDGRRATATYHRDPYGPLVELLDRARAAALTP